MYKVKFTWVILIRNNVIADVMYLVMYNTVYLSIYEYLYSIKCVNLRNILIKTVNLKLPRSSYSYNRRKTLLPRTVGTI